MMKLGEKLGILVYYERKLQNKSTEFGLEFAEKSKIKIKIEIRSQKLIKTKTKAKINPIYDSKCKSNAKGQNIRMKTRNLTQSRARNDPINH